jgi:hypothetical protein
MGTEMSIQLDVFVHIGADKNVHQIDEVLNIGIQDEQVIRKKQRADLPNAPMLLIVQA